MGFINIINKKSNSFIKYVKENFNKTNEEIEKIEYGIKVITMNMFKIIILFTTAYFLKILEHTIVAFITFGILRSFASGVHADSTIKCIFINYIVFLGNIFLAINFSLGNGLRIMFFLISLSILIKYAPADTYERPLVSIILRKKLKIRAIITLMFYGVLSVLLSISTYGDIIIYSALEQALLITPLAYKIFRKPYKNHENIKL